MGSHRRASGCAASPSTTFASAHLLIYTLSIAVYVRNVSSTASVLGLSARSTSSSLSSQEAGVKLSC